MRNCRISFRPYGSKAFFVWGIGLRLGLVFKKTKIEVYLSDMLLMEVNILVTFEYMRNSG